MTDIDFEEDSGPTVSDDDLKSITQMALRADTLAYTISNLEDEIKALKKEHDEIVNDRLPAAMDAVSMEKFSLSNGSEVAIKDIVKASLPTQAAINKAKGERQAELLGKKQRALSWLRSEGGEAIIANVLTVEVEKGKDNVVNELENLADSLGFAHDRSESVHAGSLSAFVREKLQAGATVPEEDLGLFQARQAVIKQPK